MTAHQFPPITALVMAASRSGVDDPVAKLQGKPNKCLVEIDGEVMLVRVVNALLHSGCFKKIYISIENDELLKTVPELVRLMDSGQVVGIRSEGNIADSVLAAARQIPDLLPVMITTGDNALHTPEVVRDFVSQFMSSTGDVAVAFTGSKEVLSEYPDASLAFHQLKDGGWSSCNLYGLRNEKSLKAANIFRSGGQFGKRHMRILTSLGVVPFILYKLKVVKLATLMRRIGKNLGLVVDTVVLPYGFAPIDVDNPKFFAIAEATLKKRRQSA
jgi:GTP:adenosylcobinamide-phosphate guanylyltransferase